MKYLSYQQVLYLHHQVIEETGGVHGVYNIGLLDSALNRPQATFDGIELYPTPFLKASALLHSLVNNHPFLDGNKRTALVCANFFLEDNFKVSIECSQEELVDFGFAVAQGTLNLEEIADWLKTHTRSIDNPDV